MRDAVCLQARSNVGKRLEFIRRELDRLEGQSTSLGEKLGRKQQQVWHGGVRHPSRLFGSGHVPAGVLEQQPLLKCNVLLLLQIVKLQQAIQETKDAKVAA